MNNSLQITFLDVGQGDAVVVILPDKKGCVIIDTPKKLKARNIVSTFLIENNIENVELALITHSDTDHSGVADLVTTLVNENTESKIKVKRFGFLPDRKKITSIYKLLLNQVKSFKEYNIEAWLPVESNKLEIDNVKISVLYPGMFDISGALVTKKDSNNSSTIIKIEYGEAVILLGADLEGEGWAQIIKDKKDLRSNIFKVPHHGSLIEECVGFNYKKLFRLVNPEFAIISVGTGNNYNHPSNEAIKVIKENNHNTHILCTQACGICIDKNMPIEEYRREINEHISKTSLAYNDENKCACCGSISFKIDSNGKIEISPSLCNIEKIKKKFKNCQCL